MPLFRPLVWIYDVARAPDHDLSTHPGALENIMTLCPVALTAGCKKCPVFSICPLKGLIGDHVPAEKPAPEEDEDSKD